MLKLRPYRAGDGEIIAGWIKDEISMYKWSADKFGEFPITGESINEKYLINDGDCTKPDNFYPYVACDESGAVVGHLILRYTNQDKTDIRFGFVIVDDTKRGMGLGKEMLLLALKIAYELLKAHKVTLGVFENNLSAYYCYKSVGFHELVGCDTEYTINGEKWKCIELEMTKADYASK